MTCSHPPLADISQLLICRKCHAAKVEGALKTIGQLYYLDATQLDMLVDPALVGKRVRVTIEALPEASKEVVTGAS